MRAWNPEKLNVPIGEEEEKDVRKDSECMNCRECNLCFDYDQLEKTLDHKKTLSGVVDHVAEGITSAADFF